MTSTIPFRLADPMVLDVDAAWTESESPHVNWYISYAPEREEDSLHRVLFATLHTVGESCRGNIRVAATLADQFEDAEWDIFEEELRDSDALQTLYAFARTTLRMVLSAVGDASEIPEFSPEPEFDHLVRVDEAEMADEPLTEGDESTD